MLTIFKTGNLLSLGNTTNELKNSLKEELSSGNSCFYYELMKQCRKKENILIVLHYIQEHFCKIIEDNKHLDLGFDSLKDLLSDSGLKLSSEIEVFNAADLWIKHDANERSRFAIELLKLVRFPLLSPAALDLLVKKENSFTKSLRSNEYLNKVVGKHKNKAFNTFSNDCQNRYYGNRDRFHVVSDCKSKGCECRYKIFEVEEGKPPNEVNFVKFDNELRAVLLLNGTFYFFSDHKVNSYSTQTKHWLNSTRYPANREFFRVCTFMGNIYVVGGCWERSCLLFDVETKKFKEIATTRERRVSAAVAVFGGRIICSGGFGGFPDVRTVEVYDPCANQWLEMPDMLEGRSDHASVSIGNKLYVVGGTTTECEVFDSLSQKFAYIKPILPIFEFRASPTQYLTDGNKIKIYTQCAYEVVAFDIETEVWSEDNRLELTVRPWEYFIC